MFKNVSWIVVVGVAVVAYIAGTKAGQARYGEISHAAKRVWNDPGVKKVRQQTYRKVEKAAKKAAKKIGS